MAEPGSGEDSPPGVQTAAFLLCLFERERELPGVFSYKTTNPIMRAHPRDFIKTLSPPKDPAS